MSESRVTREGQGGVRPGRSAPADDATTRPRRGKRRGGEEPMVPKAEFTSYYGQPVLNPPVWAVPDIPAYLYLGGLAGASSLMAAAATATRQPGLARVGKLGAVAGGVASLAALVHDLGRPERFLNMLRVFKVTSPMSVGSWLLAGYVPLAMAAAASDVTGRLRRAGVLATAGAATLAPGVASYTAALVSDTAVPAWHDAHRDLPLLFVGSAAVAAGGLGMAAAPEGQQALPHRMALLGVAGDLAVSHRMERRLGMVAEPYRTGRSGVMMHAAHALGVAGVVAGFVGGSRITRLGGLALMVSSALTKFAVFSAGMASARDPKYTVTPQRERMAARESRGTG